MRPLFAFLPLLKKANKVFQRWCILAFYRITQCLNKPKMKEMYTVLSQPAMNIFTLNTTISEKGENFWTHRQRPLIHVAILSCYIMSGIVNAVQGLIVLECD